MPLYNIYIYKYYKIYALFEVKCECALSTLCYFSWYVITQRRFACKTASQAFFKPLELHRLPRSLCLTVYFLCTGNIHQGYYATCSSHAWYLQRSVFRSKPCICLYEYPVNCDASWLRLAQAFLEKRVLGFMGTISMTWMESPQRWAVPRLVWPTPNAPWRFDMF